ncbi:MAG: phosphatidylserine/phosphatidylglycerophosphate/cardiolipin synthase family protein [Sphingobium sp.]|nr:phosphatidylserine/phosphatidylglycerophosphate/cardiolipin synthase family protein [Sphingobium sp.]
MTQQDLADGEPEPMSFTVDGNRLTLLPGGPDRLAALHALIASARDSLNLYFYMFTHDARAVEVREALIDACNRGVAVTLLVDAFGSAFTPDSFFWPLRDAGARFGRFGKRRSTRYLIRNHQKIVIADGRHAMVGGFNIAEDYFAPETDPAGWRDMGLQVDGPLVADLQRWFDDIAEWTLDEKQSFMALRRMVRDWRPGVGSTMWLMGGPTRHLNGWAKRLKLDLQSGKRLDLAAAYFSPGWAMVRRLGRLSRAGSARIVTAAKSDNTATIGAARHLYARLIRAGVAVFEYGRQKLHAKLIAIDDIAYVGSANFDMRSLFLNIELVLRVDDPAFAAAVRADIEAMAAASRVIDEATYRTMSGPFSRLRWWWDYLLVAVLDFTVTRRLNMWRDRSGD